MKSPTSSPGFEKFLQSAGSKRPLAGSLLLLLIIGFFVTGFVWASFTEIDEVTRGQGKIVPSQSVQEIQSLEGGVVEEIRVDRGDKVSRGDVLMVIGGGLIEGEYRENLQRSYALQAKIERLNAEINTAPLSFTSAVQAHAPQVVMTETRLFQGRQAELESEIRVLQRQHFQREQELAEQRTVLDTARAGLALARKEKNLVEPLVKRGLEPELTLLQVSRTINELTGETSRVTSTIKRLEAAVAEAKDRQQAAIDTYRATALAELSAATAELGELEKMLPARAEQVQRTQIRSPVDGIVNQLHLSTLGGIARPGEPLIEIVPLDENLLVEAHIRPSDIAFLYPGQPVSVKITAYDYARYGSLEGELMVIGADAVEVPNQEELLYPIQVRTSGQLHDADGTPLDIIPGMVAEVDILGGKRSVMDYLIEPVVKVRDRALRD